MARHFLYVHPNSGDLVIFDGKMVAIETVTLARWNCHLNAVEMGFVIKLPSSDSNHYVSKLQEMASAKKEIHLKDFTSDITFTLKLRSVDISKRSIYRVGLNCLFEAQNYEIAFKSKNDEKPLSLALPSIKSASSLAPPPSAVKPTKSESDNWADFIELD